MELGFWEPIETAPRDGTAVLVLLDCGGVDVVHVARYRTRDEWDGFSEQVRSDLKWINAIDSLQEWEGWWSYTLGRMSQEKLDGYRMPIAWHPMLKKMSGE